MATYTVTSDVNLRDFITDNGMVTGDYITVNNGATVTVTETPSILLFDITVNRGNFVLDGENISQGNMINFCMQSNDNFVMYGDSIFQTKGAWYDLAVTTGLHDQEVSLSDYWDGVADIIPMIQVETGRRIDFDNVGGIDTPKVHDVVYKTTDRSVMGKVVDVFDDYLNVRWLTGTLADDDSIEIHRVVNEKGSVLRKVWTATVNNPLGDILAPDIYQEFGNVYHEKDNQSEHYGTGINGFIFNHTFHDKDILTLSNSLGGFVPPAGCKIRVPNVHISSATTSDYLLGISSYYTSPDTYACFLGRAATFDMRVTNCGTFQGASSYQGAFTMECVGGYHALGGFASSGVMDYKRCVVLEGHWTGKGSHYPRTGFSTQESAQSVTIDQCMWLYTRASQWKANFVTMKNIKVTNCIVVEAYGGTPMYSYGIRSWSFVKCKDIHFEGNFSFMGDSSSGGEQINFENCQGIVAKYNHYAMHSDLTKQHTKTTDHMQFTSCSDVYVEDVRVMGEACCDRYLMQFDNCSSTKVRAIGSKEYPMKMHDNPYDVFISSGAADDTDIARCYFYNINNNYRIGSNSPTSSRFKLTNVECPYPSDLKLFGTVFSNMRGVAASATNLSLRNDGSQGKSFGDVFNSDTTGKIFAVCPKPSEESEYTFPTGNIPTADGRGTMYLEDGDIVIIESSYYALGHTGFDGTRTVDAGTSNSAWTRNFRISSDSTYEMQYKFTDTDWNGTWISVDDSATLTSIVGSFSKGVKVKFKISAINNTENRFGLIALGTTTTLQDRDDNMYPIDQEFVKFTAYGIKEGTEVRVFNSNTLEEISGTETLVGTSFEYEYEYSEDIPVNVVLIHLEYEVESIQLTLSDMDTNIPIQQRIDRNYENK